MSALRHCGIVVKNVERAIAFYTEQFGFEVVDDREEGGEYLGYILGIPGVQARTVKLKDSRGAGTIELLQFHSAPGRRQMLPPELTGFGPTHLALTVADIDGLYRSLSADGIRFLTPPTLSEDGRVKLAFCQDHDGVFLELVEEL